MFLDSLGSLRAPLPKKVFEGTEIGLLPLLVPLAVFVPAGRLSCNWVYHPVLRLASERELGFQTVLGTNAPKPIEGNHLWCHCPKHDKDSLKNGSLLLA